MKESKEIYKSNDEKNTSFCNTLRIEKNVLTFLNPLPHLSFHTVGIYCQIIILKTFISGLGKGGFRFGG
jgi:hypothetical protein